MDKLYDRFIGKREAEAHAFLPDGALRRHYWQIRFEKALEGRAIRWRAEISRDDGAHWHKAIDMLAQRIKEAWPRAVFAGGKARALISPE